MRRVIWPALILAILAGGRARAASPLGAYDLYPTAAEGSARYVALGGAIVAAPRDYGAVFINPAGLGGLAGHGIDFGSDSSNVDNFVIDPSQPDAKSLSDPINFSFYGVRYVSDDGWGIGVAEQNPYNVDDVFNGTARVAKPSQGTFTGEDHTEIQAKDSIYTAAIAKTYFDNRLTFVLWR